MLDLFNRVVQQTSQYLRFPQHMDESFQLICKQKGLHINQTGCLLCQIQSDRGEKWWNEMKMKNSQTTLTQVVSSFNSFKHVKVKPGVRSNNPLLDTSKCQASLIISKSWSLIEKWTERPGLSKTWLSLDSFISQVPEQW